MVKRSGRTFRNRKCRRQTAYSATEVKSNCGEHKYVSFMKWLKKNGFKQIMKLRFHEFEETGRGLMTLEAIKPATTCISIPEKLLITPDYVLSTHVGHLLSSKEELSGLEILTLFLMYEKTRGEVSEWFAYISTLPEIYDTSLLLKPLLWKLLPPSMGELYHEQSKRIKKSFSVILKSLSCIPNLKLSQRTSFDLFTWAYFTVNTRAVYKECEHINCGNTSCGFHLALVPYLDFLNHNWEAKVKAGFNKQNRCFEIVSHSAYKKYSQFFINYGGHSNRKLLMEYGFIQDGNTNDIIPVSLDDIQLAMAKHCSETLLSEIVSFLDGNVLNKMGIGIDGLTWSLETILKVACEKDKSRWRKIVFDMSMPSNCSKYKNLLKELIQLKLQEYRVIHLLRETHMLPSSTAILSTLCKLLLMEQNMLQKTSLESLEQLSLTTCIET